MTTAKKKRAKAPAKSSAKATPKAASKSSAKASGRKAAGAKSAAAPPKKPSKAAPRREEASAAPRTPARRASPRKRKSPSPPVATGAVRFSDADARNRLGSKWICFKCGAKFYDLNKPEPLCPKCNANQNERSAAIVPPPSWRWSA
jgi:rubrerythrin